MIATYLIIIGSFISPNAKIPMTCICPNSKCHALSTLFLDITYFVVWQKIMSIRKYRMVCLLRAWFIGGRIIVAWKLMHGPHFIAPIFSAKYTLYVFINGSNRIFPLSLYSLNKSDVVSS